MADEGMLQQEVEEVLALMFLNLNEHRPCQLRYQPLRGSFLTSECLQQAGLPTVVVRQGSLWTLVQHHCGFELDLLPLVQAVQDRWVPLIHLEPAELPL